VVDPAPSEEALQGDLIQYVKDRQAAGDTFTALVLTHHHRDHMGAALAMHQALGLPIHAHEKTAALVDFPVQHTLQDAEALDCDGPSWTGVFTPGHAAGHLCFLRGSDRALIAGDMVAGVGTILVDPEEGSMRGYLQSLERLRALDPSVLFPAHGFEMRPGVEHLDHYLMHRRMRAAAVLERVKAGDATPEDMVPHIYVGTPPSFFGLAARSVWAMLIMHQEDGAVVQQGERWVLA